MFAALLELVDGVGVVLVAAAGLDAVCLLLEFTVGGLGAHVVNGARLARVGGVAASGVTGRQLRALVAVPARMSRPLIGAIESGYIRLGYMQSAQQLRYRN